MSAGWKEEQGPIARSSVEVMGEVKKESAEFWLIATSTWSVHCWLMGRDWPENLKVDFCFLHFDYTFLDFLIFILPLPVIVTTQIDSGGWPLEHIELISCALSSTKHDVCTLFTFWYSSWWRYLRPFHAQLNGTSNHWSLFLWANTLILAVSPFHAQLSGMSNLLSIFLGANAQFLRNMIVPAIKATIQSSFSLLDLESQPRRKLEKIQRPWVLFGLECPQL